MLGDSFCKPLREEVPDYLVESFQSPCLGTLFARERTGVPRLGKVEAFNPHAWGLFLQARSGLPSGQKNNFFQSPCLGTLFASRADELLEEVLSIAFNPHAWGLFLQVRGVKGGY